MPVIYAELWLLHCQPALESNQSSITRILSVSIQPTGSAMGCILIHKGGAPKHLLLFLMKRAPGSGSLKYPFVLFTFFLLFQISKSSTRSFYIHCHSNSSLSSTLSTVSSFLRCKCLYLVFSSSFSIFYIELNLIFSMYQISHLLPTF